MLFGMGLQRAECRVCLAWRTIVFWLSTFQISHQREWATWLQNVVCRFVGTSETVDVPLTTSAASKRICGITFLLLICALITAVPSHCSKLVTRRRYKELSVDQLSTT